MKLYDLHFNWFLTGNASTPRMGPKGYEDLLLLPFSLLALMCVLMAIYRLSRGNLRRAGGLPGWTLLLLWMALAFGLSATARPWPSRITAAVAGAMLVLLLGIAHQNHHAWRVSKPRSPRISSMHTCFCANYDSASGPCQWPPRRKPEGHPISSWSPGPRWSNPSRGCRRYLRTPT